MSKGKADSLARSSPQSTPFNESTSIYSKIPTYGRHIERTLAWGGILRDGELLFSNDDPLTAQYQPHHQCMLLAKNTAIDSVLSNGIFLHVTYNYCNIVWLCSLGLCKTTVERYLSLCKSKPLLMGWIRPPAAGIKCFA